VVALLGVWSIATWHQVGEAYRVWGKDKRITPIRDDIIVPAYVRELRLHPDAAHIHLELGIIHQQQGRREPARHYRERAAELEPDPRPLVLLAMQRQVREPQKAIALLTRAVQLAPEEVSLRLLIARALLGVGDSAAALRHLQAASRLAPDDPAVHAALQHVRDRAPAGGVGGGAP
jgi:tetratricopeptide (TPR) repeat protein